MLLLATVPSLVRGVLLQDGSYVVDLVEDLDGALYVFRPRAVDHQVEDVEVTGFCLHVPPYRLVVEQAPVHVIRQADRPELGEDLALGRAVLAVVSEAAVDAHHGQHLAKRLCLGLLEPVAKHLGRRLGGEPVRGVAPPAVREGHLIGVDARLLVELLHHREGVVAIRAARLDGHQAQVEVGAVVVADLEYELGVLAVVRRNVGRDLVFGRVGALLRQLGGQVLAGRGGDDGDARATQRLDKRRAREGGRVVDRRDPQLLAGVRRDVPADYHRAVRLRAHAQDRRLAGGNGLGPHLDMVGRYLRPPKHNLRLLSHFAGLDLNVDEVVVYGDRPWPRVEVGGVEGEGVHGGALRCEIEEPLVDYDVAFHALDAGLAHLLGDLVEPRKWVFGGERRTRHAVGVGVVDGGVGDGPIGRGAPAHGKVAAGYEHQVAA